jgi:phosphoribosylamine--glycine ligase
MIWRKPKEELRNMLVHQKFGAASTKVVIEEFLDGIELSCFVLTDGKSYKILQQRKITNALAKATLD